MFCDDSSERIIEMLVAECDAGRVHWRRPIKVARITRDTARDTSAGSHRFMLEGSDLSIRAEWLVIASGGLSIPKIGASDFAYRVARQFGLRVIEPRPALVPLTFAADSWKAFVALAGVALEVNVTCGSGRDQARFREDMLFTHRGLSGPAILQISSFWKPGEALAIDLAPTEKLVETLIEAKSATRLSVVNALAQSLPRRLALHWFDASDAKPQTAALRDRRLADVPDRDIRRFADALQPWTIAPNGTKGFKKAEVTRGGIDTRELSQRTMEAVRVPGLHFIGEAVDVTGWLGGYNFQWAWASGFAAGQAV